MLALRRALKAVLNNTTSFFSKEFLVLFLLGFTVNTLCRDRSGDKSFFSYFLTTIDAYPKCAIIDSLVKTNAQGAGRFRHMLN
jgi:hypothetical protein